MDPVQIVDLYSRILTAHIFEGLYDYDHLARPFLIRPATAVALPEISGRFPHVDRAHQARHLLSGRPGVQGQASANWSRRTTSTR